MSAIDLGSEAWPHSRGGGNGSPENGAAAAAGRPDTAAAARAGRPETAAAARAARALAGARSPLEPIALEAFGELAPISRLGGQGRVHRPARTPPALGPGPLVVKLYRRAPPLAAAQVLSEMVAWRRSLEYQQRLRLEHLAAWPLAVVSAAGEPVGIAMRDVSQRFAVPFVMPSGRREHVLLALEHLLGADGYLQMRGLGVWLDTAMRALVAERISIALAFLHRHAIVASDLAPSNLLISFGARGPAACFIDCDSMVFRGRQALTSVETGDWNMPAGYGEPAATRGADAYKLGLVVLRLFARCHDARALQPHSEHVPAPLRPLLARALAADARNRPPAGEWQRALRQLVADRHINGRYPGPAPRAGVRSIPPRAAARAGARADSSSSAARSRSSPPSSRSALSARPAPALPRPPIQLRRTVAILWLVAGTVILFLLLSRLFATAIPQAPGAGGFGGAGGGSPYGYRYYNPPAGQLQGGGGARGGGQALFPGSGQIVGSP